MNRTQQAWLSDSTGLWGINKTQAKTGISRKELQRDLPSVEAYQRTKEQPGKSRFHCGSQMSKLESRVQNQ